VVNAKEAILNTGWGSGTITVDGRVVSHNGVDLVELRFSDAGQDIPPHRLDHIFEHGYSKRRTGSGSIGLRWCASSLAEGSIWAMSNGIGRGHHHHRLAADLEKGAQIFRQAV
jgi:signal transduction histidine kinase